MKYTVSVDTLESPIELRQFLAEVEQDLINMALATTENNKQAASTLLGCNRTTLVEKMKKYGMPLKAPYERRKK